MQPQLLALTPFYPPTLAALERDYVVHKLWEARDAHALMHQISPAVRGIVTTGLYGCTRAYIDALSLSLNFGATE